MMDRKTARKIVYTLSHADREFLEDLLAEARMPLKQSILDEEWRYDKTDNAVYDQNGTVVGLRRETAALPDALRVLVDIVNIAEHTTTIVSIAKDGTIFQMIVDALKKAGIE